jgi:hypothetical protein
MVGSEVEGAALVDFADRQIHAKVKKSRRAQIVGSIKVFWLPVLPAVLPGLGLAGGSTLDDAAVVSCSTSRHNLPVRSSRACTRIHLIFGSDL